MPLCLMKFLVCDMICGTEKAWVSSTVVVNFYITLKGLPALALDVCAFLSYTIGIATGLNIWYSYGYVHIQVVKPRHTHTRPPIWRKPLAVS